MEFQEVVDRRRMIRNYADEPVDPAVVDRALRNATHAPSAGFSQGWGFLVLDTPTDVRRWWATTADSVDQPDAWLTGMMRAPVVIVPCSSKAAYLRRYAEDDKAGSRRLVASRAAAGGVAGKAEEEDGPGLPVDDDNAAGRPPGGAQQPSRRRDPASGWVDQSEDHWPVPYWHMDAAMASLLILQTVVDEGLGGCFFGIPVEKLDAVRTEFGIDPDFDPVGVITIGHRVASTGAAGSPAKRRRTPIENVVHRGTWAT